MLGGGAWPEGRQLGSQRLPPVPTGSAPADALGGASWGRMSVAQKASALYAFRVTPSRSLFSQLQEILAELWLTSEHRPEREVNLSRIEEVLDIAEGYATDDPETFDAALARARRSLASGDLESLGAALRELAEMSRSGATSFG